MKKLFAALTILACTTALSAQPQGRPPAREKIESMKIAFLTDRLNLTPEQAQSFWPVYNKYNDDLSRLRKEHREGLADARRDFNSMSDKELEKMVDNEIAFRQEELDIMKRYLPQFRQVLSVRQVAELYTAEEDFKRKLIEMIQQRRDQPRKNNMR
jgi:Spy/CpxP family protein refolding chaperone